MPHPRALLQLSGISRTRIHPCGSWVRPGPAWLRLLHSRSAHSPLPEATLKRSDPCTELSNGLILVLKRESVLETVLHIRGARGPRSTTASRSLTLQSPGCFSPAALREPGEPLRHTHPDQRRGGREPGHRGCCCQSPGGSQTPPWRVPRVLMACPLGKGTTPSEHPEPPGPAAGRGRAVGEEPLTTA